MATRQNQTGAVVIGLHELEALQKRFQHLSEQLQHDDSLVEQIGDQQANSAKRRIMEAKREPSGQRWKPWSERYRKTVKNPNHSLLRKTGALLDSITYEVRGPWEVEVGSNLEYAGAHLRGTDRIPARPYLDTEPGFSDPSDRRELREIVRDYLDDVVKDGKGRRRR